MGRSTVYNKDQTAYWDQVQQKNKDLVAEFIKYCRQKNLSPQTISQYEEWLKIFFSWNYAENSDKFFIDLKKRDFIYYLGRLREQDLSSKRINNLKSALSSMSNAIELLYEDEYPYFKNQLRGLEAIESVAVREKTVLSVDQIRSILNTLVEHKHYQAACYVAAAAFSGARKAEILQMKISDFSEDKLVLSGQFYRTDKIRTKGRGKRGKLLNKYILKQGIDPYLKLWLEERKRRGIESPYVFVTKDKNTGEYKQMTQATANYFSAVVSKLCNIDFYAHACRHFFCTQLKRLKYPDDVIVKIIGWENSSMIPIYSDITDEELMEDFFKNNTLKLN